MRIGLITLLLMSSVMACDQPFESVGGYKIGCPLLEIDQSKEVTEKESATGIVREYRYSVDNFFDYAYVRTDDQDIVQSVVFEKKYIVNKRNIKEEKRAIKSNFQTFYTSLKARWGDASQKEATLLLSRMDTSDLSFLRQIDKQYILINPADSVVERIALFTTSDSDSSLYIRNYDKSIFFYIAYLAEGVEEERMGESGDITKGF